MTDKEIDVYFSKYDNDNLDDTIYEDISDIKNRYIELKNGKCSKIWFKDALANLLYTLKGRVVEGLISQEHADEILDHFWSLYYD